ncbi:hypothetical protein [Streptomyces sp. XH2]|uniref:hypothetical protein n=1 Tax=Streptomyces sp. XH2 TaxID=3412483 RepID=UPI003C7D4C10
MTDNRHNPKPQTVKLPRRTTVATWWTTAWSEGGVLYRRWEEILLARRAGWHEMANWIKAVLGLAGVCAVLVLLDAAADVIDNAVTRLLTAAPAVQVGTDTSSGVWGVIDNPVRSYIAQRSTGLAISGSTLYTAWEIAGLLGLIGGFFRSTGARITWITWGAASIAMVWSASPAANRTVATGIAALAWTLASVLALRGLSLRPVVVNHIYNAGHEIRPEIHIPAPADPPADDTLDNVRPLQKR